MQALDQIDGDVAVKSPVSWQQWTSGSSDAVGTYTRRLTQRAARLAAPKIRDTPVYLQPYVEKLYEIRATVIGEEVFACRIDSQASPHTRVDWRHYDFDRVAHEAMSLSSASTAMLVPLTKALGLTYAALDLIVGLYGELIFVELNPSGHYGWIEAITDLPISAAIASHLCSKGAPTLEVTESPVTTYPTSERPPQNSMETFHATTPTITSPS